MSAPESFPTARHCWICKAAKVVLRVVGGFEHRMCTNCDAPGLPGRVASWQQEAPES